MKFSELTDDTMPVPPGIAKEFIENEKFCKRYGQITVAYDPHTQVGGMYHIGMREWALWWPLTPGQYADRVDRALETYEITQMAEKPDTVN